jgi:hypothetical protein
MRGIAQQNAIRRMRHKFIHIATFQDKSLTTKRAEMRDIRLESKAKLKRVKFKIELKKIQLEI